MKTYFLSALSLAQILLFAGGDNRGVGLQIQHMSGAVGGLKSGTAHRWMRVCGSRLDPLGHCLGDHLAWLAPDSEAVNGATAAEIFTSWPEPPRP